MRKPPVDVAAEALLLAGGARAILLQLANPAVGRGVAEHSDFERRPLERLGGTLTYLYVVAFGTPDEVSRVAVRVGRSHAPVRGPGYDARDPDLQLWVAATLYETGARMYELVYGPLGASQAEDLLDRGAAVATTLGVPRASWPATPADFAAYWGSCQGGLRVDAPARAVAAALLHPRHAPWWFRALLPPIRVLTAGLLEPRLRVAYGLPFDQRRYDRLVRALRVVYPGLPRAIRHAPMRHYLRKFRAEPHA